MERITNGLQVLVFGFFGFVSVVAMGLCAWFGISILFMEPTAYEVACFLLVLTPILGAISVGCALMINDVN